MSYVRQKQIYFEEGHFSSKNQDYPYVLRGRGGYLMK